MQKIFVLNRILDEQKASEYKKLIKQSGHIIIKRSFLLSEYSRLSYDLKSIPSAEVWFTGKYRDKQNQFLMIQAEITQYVLAKFFIS